MQRKQNKSFLLAAKKYTNTLPDDELWLIFLLLWRLRTNILLKEKKTWIFQLLFWDHVYEDGKKIPIYTFLYRLTLFLPIICPQIVAFSFHQWYWKAEIYENTGGWHSTIFTFYTFYSCFINFYLKTATKNCR